MELEKKLSMKSILEGDFNSRIHHITPNECSFEVASSKLDSWRANGEFSVFHAGAYDLLTLNHLLGLTECRTLGATALLGLNGVYDAPQEQIHEVAASDSVRLMVTMDTNRALTEGKSRRSEKGGALKPILDWNTRAAMLAAQSIPTHDYSARHNTTDFITRHGPDSCQNCKDGICTNEDNALMVMRLQPDLVVVNAASIGTIESIEQYKSVGLLPNTQVAVVREEDNQYNDDILQGPVKTTTIINRIRM